MPQQAAKTSFFKIHLAFFFKIDYYYHWRDIADENVSEENEAILQYAENLTSYGIKTYDALHIACAIYAKCDYYITTDTKLLKTKLKEIKIVNPIDFIMENHYED